MAKSKSKGKQDQIKHIYTALKLTICLFPAAPQKQGISSQNAKVSKSSDSKKAVAVEPLKNDETKSDDFEKFGSSDSEYSDEEDTHLEGFESSDDEEEVEEDFDAKTGLSKDSKVAAEQTKKLEQVKASAAEAADSQTSKDRGVLYIGRIPHGFYEDQMRAYFSQFGTVTRLRLSRNKKTGQSKHYAFVEFESAQVAKVVADTMDNYLLFGHILKVKLMSEDQIRDDLFVGANKKFKVLNWASQNHIATNAPKTRKHWEEVQAKEKEYRQKRSERLKSIGIDYSYDSPAPAAEEDKSVEEKKAVAPKTASKPKTKKKGTKRKA